MTTAPEYRPHGLGIYYGSSDMHVPSKSAALCLSAGATWAAVLVQSVDGRKQDPARVADVCASLRDVNITPWLYSFPTPGMPVSQPIAYLGKCAKAANTERVAWDVEPYQGFDWKQPEVDDLVRAFPSCSITLYDRPQWHRLSWHQRPIWLQVYSASKETIKLAAVSAKWPRAVPCFAAYDGSADDMEADAIRCATMARSSGAAAVWSLASVSPIKAATLKAWALSTWAPPA